MQDQDVFAAHKKNQGYGDAVRILLRLINLQAVVIILLTAGLCYFVRQGHVPDRYYALTFNNRAMQMQSFAEPSVNQEFVLRWATQSAIQVMTFGFHDLSQRFSEYASFFTDEGLKSFVKALMSSGLYLTVQKQQQILTTVPRGDATVTFEGYRDGYYTWEVEVPLLITARSGNKKRTARQSVILTVIKVPTRRNPYGLGIQKWFMY